MSLCTAPLCKALGVKGTHLTSLVRPRRVARYEIPSRGEPQCCLDYNLRERERGERERERERASDVESGAHVTRTIKLG